MARRHFFNVFHGTFFFCKRGVGCDAFFGKRNLCPNCAYKARLRPKTFLQSGGAICDRTPRTPPQTARGPKKNQNAFQLPLVSGHPSRAMFQNELFLLNNVEPPQKISARSVGAAILVPPTPSSPPGRNNVRKGHRFLSLNAPRASPRPLKPNNVRKGHRCLTLNAPRASPQTPKAK